MTLFEQIQISTNETIVITDSHIKMRVLNELTEARLFKPLRFMHKADLLNKVFFAYEHHALPTAVVFCKQRPSLVENWLKLLYVVDETVSYTRERLNTLQKLKQHLHTSKALRIDVNAQAFFKGKSILIQLADIDPLTERALEWLKTITPITIVQPPIHPTPKLIALEFSDTEHEMAYVAETIAHRMKEGVAAKRIKVVLHGQDYVTKAPVIFRQFGVALETMPSYPLANHRLARTCLDALDTVEGGDLFSTFAVLIETLRADLKGSEDMRVFAALLRVVNPLVIQDLDWNTFKSLVHHTLKTTNVRKPTHPDVIETVTLNALDCEAIEHLFVLGCIEGLYPAYKQENDYLSATEKAMVGLPDAKVENRRIKSDLDRVYKTVPHTVLTFAKQGLQRRNFPAADFTERKTSCEAEAHTSDFEVRPSRSQVFDCLRAKFALDTFTTYGQDTLLLKTLHHTFAAEFIPFDNRFTGLAKQTIDDLMPVPLRLSYTKLQTFFQCRFRYALEQWLKLDDRSQTFNLDLGIFFHAALEQYLEGPLPDETMLKRDLATLLEQNNHPYSASQMFFFRNSITVLQQVIDTIRHQRSRSSYQVLNKELYLEYTIDKEATTFNGIIDQVLSRIDEGTTGKRILLDYKTGQPTLKLTHSVHGLSAQLLYYMWLYRQVHGGASITFTGFYEQTVFPRPFKHDPKKPIDQQFADALAWSGYTLNDANEMGHLDHDIGTGSYINSLKFTKKGALHAAANVFETKPLEQLLDTMGTTVLEAVQAIKAGSFTIDPKYLLKKDLSCTYCSFADVCFKRQEDYVALSVPESDAALFALLEKQEDNHGH